MRAATVISILALVGTDALAAGRTVAPPHDHRLSHSMSGCFADRAHPPDSLVQAARCLDLDAALTYLRGDDIEQHDEDGYTPLIGAIAAHDVWDHADHHDKIAQMVTLLLQNGAHPNVRFTYGTTDYTPLHYAAYDGDTTLVKLLLASGANVHAVDGRGYTALHAAAKCDFRLSGDAAAAAMVKLLVEHGADPRVRGKDGVLAIDRVPETCTDTRRALTMLQTRP